MNFTTVNELLSVLRVLIDLEDSGLRDDVVKLILGKIKKELESN